MAIRYFDHAASQPVLDAAMQTFVDVSRELYGNPSSTHGAGFKARARLDRAREEFSALCGFSDGKLVLTSSGTEANNLVINNHTEGRLLVAADVHPSIWYKVEQETDRSDVLPLSENGRVLAETVKHHLKRDTTLVAVSHVCNETGVIHPISEISQVCAAKGVALLVDGVQAVGHIPVNLEDYPCQYYTFSAHKFGGPRGVGGLLLRDSELQPLGGGGAQEWGMRPGTENVAGLAAATTALACCVADLHDESARLRKLTQFLAHFLQSLVPTALLNTDPEYDLPGLLSISIPGIQSQNVVAELSFLGFASSAGSACHSDTVLASRAILGRGRSEDEALGTLRFSMGRTTRKEDVFDLGQAVQQVVERQLRQRIGGVRNDP